MSNSSLFLIIFLSFGEKKRVLLFVIMTSVELNEDTASPHKKIKADSEESRSFPNAYLEENREIERALEEMEKRSDHTMASKFIENMI
jgi:hypothetical protein